MKKVTVLLVIIIGLTGCSNNSDELEGEISIAQDKIEILSNRVIESNSTIDKLNDRIAILEDVMVSEESTRVTFLKFLNILKLIRPVPHPNSITE